LATGMGYVELIPLCPRRLLRPSRPTSTRLRPPFLKPALDRIEQRHTDHPRGHEQEDADEDDVGVKHVAGLCHHMAEARGRRVKLADDDPEQRAAGAGIRT